MAELELKKALPGVKRLAKRATRVDLTPMVDLGFLLITFFVFTNSMSLPKAMEMRDTREGDPTPIPHSCTITFFLDNANRISYYEGMPESHPVVKETTFSTDGIRQVLLKKKTKVGVQTGNPDSAVVIIKPGSGSTMQNFVDIMDEIAITGIKYYYVADLAGMDRRIFGKQ